MLRVRNKTILPLNRNAGFSITRAANIGICRKISDFLKKFDDRTFH